MISNESYEHLYSVSIEPLYGSIRNILEDNNTCNNNTCPHDYTIHQRTDFTEYSTYSIDPPGCEDADDAFSVYKENERLYLVIHIADPTELININSSLWSDIKKRIVTRYPSNRKPVHMMPQDIVERSSLMENKYGNTKNAVSILTEIDQITYCPIGHIQLLFTIVKVNPETSLTYNSACSLCESDFVLSTGLKISEALKLQRANETIGTKLNDVNPSYIDYTTNDCPQLITTNQKEVSMKQMIAEFAIFANSFVGEYLKIHMNGMGIFRTCQAKEWLDTVNNQITGEDLLNEIITNGIKADYMSSNLSHDLVGKPEYCHFTSPIRRLSDCVCHYLLKYLYLKNMNENIETPFSPGQLDNIANECINMTKKIKNIQYRDTKFRLVQVIRNIFLLHPDRPVHLTFFVSSYKGLFLNIIICNIENYKVYMSYTLRVKNFDTMQVPIKNKITIPITRVMSLKQYDEGSIPELDSYLLEKIK
jgi:exoribonuclease R